MNTLFIDTSNIQEIIIAVEKDGKKTERKFPLDKSKAEATLPAIQDLLAECDLTVHDIDHVEVKRGPGSFTGLRVGVSIANALSFALGIPINKRKSGIMEEPNYADN